jgi:putative hemolysin
VTATSVLIAPQQTRFDCDPRYTLLLTSEPSQIRAAQRLRYQVFSTESGFTLRNDDELDIDRFDDYCDHLVVREDHTGELVGCYRMLPPPGAIAAGGLYSAGEFDISALDTLRPFMVEMGRAVVRADHRNGAVILMMWTGILAYLDRCGYDYVVGCVSVPTHAEGPPGSQLRGIRDAVLARHGAAPEFTVHPYRPVRGYLRLGAQICGEPAHDPAFGVGDFLALLDKRRADLRLLTRLRSAAAAGQHSAAIAQGMHRW